LKLYLKLILKSIFEVKMRYPVYVLFLFQFQFVQTILERERDIARADVKRLIDERDALREKLEVENGNHKLN